MGLRTDPYEFAETTSNTYWDWVIHQPFAIYKVGDTVVGGAA
jgi:hypothetical protein